MNKLWRLFVYKENVEYYVPINDIKIKYEFQLHSPKPWKFRVKEKQFLEDNIIGRIELNRDFELIDGYCSYLIYKKYGLNKVPVYFTQDFIREI